MRQQGSSILEDTMTRMRMFVLVLSITALAAACATTNGQKADSPSALAVASSADRTLAENIVSASRWTGTWGNIGDPSSGTVAFRFYRDHSGLAGEFLGLSGSFMGPTVPVGALRWLSVSGGVVKFTTPSGANYVLRREGNCLKGMGKLGMTTLFWVNVCPQ